MTLDHSDVERIAHLASLGLNYTYLSQTTAALNSILRLVNQIQDIDTGSIEPLAHPLESRQRLCVDVVTEQNNRASYQAIAPAVEKGLYLVPKVID
ncbi:Asp-tRNA(Asn)/Glu-tRNA(Gln) amidotransferase subunit GatC [Candidatus Pseudomonas adelgestsugas]|uniref:Aspartyl/glutamyl-tRNA(Asn/Gln) amidotransferase subunit C n=1 Tax=Candidatus Pseudomonas adelgestsugas TaxID=1302376 RepID=A0ABX5R999_9PSED|nr:Asp-tRNA(Asn)/Glu-tRNA(Gln) amidotransferase subunit GatC [Candidatus Pseudomonas adelgestsugas]QAX81868.1 aspartyl/glutamyl-tRNA amidotransferase subunit C [Candidatus Pseudomonas adelgestsugas]